MSDVPTFFVPTIALEAEEAAYAELAQLCGRPVLSRGARIYSITYLHDGEEWTATVGERLQGVRVRYSRSRPKKIERTSRLTDPAIVLAIFSGEPFKVVTNAWNGGSAWVNPFMVGRPTSVKHFS